MTSLPDVSEVPHLGFAGWRAWFIEVVRLACAKVHDDAVAVFYQTDIKHEGRWIDKAFMVQLGAEQQARALPVAQGRVPRAGGHDSARAPRVRAPAVLLAALAVGARAVARPDVLPRLGAMPWPRAMGVEACEAVARFLVTHTTYGVVVDPFCGVGTMLAVANTHGLDAVGVELSPKRAARSRELVVAPSKAAERRPSSPPKDA